MRIAGTCFAVAHKGLASILVAQVQDPDSGDRTCRRVSGMNARFITIAPDLAVNAQQILIQQRQPLSLCVIVVPFMVILIVQLDTVLEQMGRLAEHVASWVRTRALRDNC
ncbi:hypothetical protein D3C77_640770 [compost metagenome]